MMYNLLMLLIILVILLTLITIIIQGKKLFALMAEDIKRKKDEAFIEELDKVSEKPKKKKNRRIFKRIYLAIRMFFRKIGWWFQGVKIKLKKKIIEKLKDDE